MRDLLMVSQDDYRAKVDDYRAKVGAAKLGKAITGSRSRGDTPQSSPAHCKGGNQGKSKPPELAAQVKEGSSRGGAKSAKQASQAPGLNRPSAAGPLQERGAADGANDIISLTSSAQTLRNSSGDEVTLTSHGSRERRAAGAGTPAVTAESFSTGDGEGSEADAEGSDDPNWSQGRVPVAGRQAHSAQPSSSATVSLPKEQRFSKVRGCALHAVPRM